MFTEEKKKNTNYGTIFVYCFFCFAFVVEVIRLAEPYYNLKQSLVETEALVEDGFLDVENSGILPCNFLRSRSVSVPTPSHQKLSAVVSVYRERPPTSYCVKFESFTNLSKVLKTGKYESRPFPSGGYNWTFIIYPNGNQENGTNQYVSLYAKLDTSSLVANPKDVYAEIKFFAYKRTYDKYWVVEETEAQRFHLFKPVWGMANFLPISFFQKPEIGFIFDDGKSVLGIDIFVAPTFENWEVSSFEENVRDPVFDWMLTNFSLRSRDFYTSDPFTSGGRNWVLKVYPNGVGSATDKSLSLFLLSASNESGYVKAKLRVINQTRSTHVEKQVEGSPNAAENGWGFADFIPLADIRDSSKGFLVNDNIKFEVEIVAFFKTDSI